MDILTTIALQDLLFVEYLVASRFGNTWTYAKACSKFPLAKKVTQKIVLGLEDLRGQRIVSQQSTAS